MSNQIKKSSKKKAKNPTNASNLIDKKTTTIQPPKGPRRERKKSPARIQYPLGLTTGRPGVVGCDRRRRHHPKPPPSWVGSSLEWNWKIIRNHLIIATRRWRWWFVFSTRPWWALMDVAVDLELWPLVAISAADPRFWWEEKKKQWMKHKKKAHTHTHTLKTSSLLSLRTWNRERKEPKSIVIGNYCIMNVCTGSRLIKCWDIARARSDLPARFAGLTDLGLDAHGFAK